MKKLFAVLVVLMIASLVILGCGGGGSSTSAPPSTTGTWTVTGAPTVSGAFSVPTLYTAQAATIMGTPTSVKMKPIKIFLAENADCTNPVLVQDKTGSAVYEDIVGKPTLFSSTTVTPGTYHCMIVKMTDILKFTPDSTAEIDSSNVCMAGQEYSFDIFKTESPVAENWYDLETNSTIPGDGTPGTPVEQTVFLYVTTDQAAAMAANNLIHLHQTGPLGSPLVITAGAETKSAMVVDVANSMSVLQDTQVVPPTNYCWLEQLNTSFITQ